MSHPGHLEASSPVNVAKEKGSARADRPSSRLDSHTESSTHGQGAIHLSAADRRRLDCTQARLAVEQLSAAPLLADRIEIYNRHGRHIIWMAAGCFPELMPVCNGEFEFLELGRADHD